MEEKTTEKRNALRRAVAIGLAGFLLCLGFSVKAPDLTDKLTKPIRDKSYKEYLAKTEAEFQAQDKRKIIDEEKQKLDWPNLSDDERRKAMASILGRLHGEMMGASIATYMNEFKPAVSKKEKLVEFGVLAGAGFFIALLGLLASAWWTTFGGIIFSRGLTSMPQRIIDKPVATGPASFRQIMLAIFFILSYKYRRS